MITRLPLLSLGEAPSVGTVDCRQTDSPGSRLGSKIKHNPSDINPLRPRTESITIHGTP